MDLEVVTSLHDVVTIDTSVLDLISGATLIDVADELFGEGRAAADDR
jgi:hypothetical protein